MSILPEIRIANCADMEFSFMSGMAGADFPRLGGDGFGGRKGGSDIVLPFQIYVVSADENTLVLGITKGYVNGGAAYTNALAVPANFSGRVYLKCAAAGGSSYNVSFYATSEEVQDGDGVGYLLLGWIAEGKITNIRTTSFHVQNCQNTFVFYAV